MTAAVRRQLRAGPRSLPMPLGRSLKSMQTPLIFSARGCLLI